MDFRNACADKSVSQDDLVGFALIPDVELLYCLLKNNIKFSDDEITTNRSSVALKLKYSNVD